MKLLRGHVAAGSGIAAKNLAHVAGLIQDRTGLQRLEPGTLNVIILSPYVARADARIEKDECDNIEFIKLQRCRLRGLRCLIMRPSNHEGPGSDATCRLEILSEIRLRSHFGLDNGDSVEVEIEGDDAWWNGP